MSNNIFFDLKRKTKIVGVFERHCRTIKSEIFGILFETLKVKILFLNIVTKASYINQELVCVGSNLIQYILINLTPMQII